MSFDELIENLVYAASVFVASPNRAAPDSLKWAADRLRARYGHDEFTKLLAFRSLSEAIQELRAHVSALIRGSA